VELVETLRTTRSILRSALQRLVDEGVVRRIRGSGTYAVAYGGPSDIGRMRSLQESHGAQRSSYRVLEAGLEAASDPVARALEIESGDPVVLLERLAVLDGEPVALFTHWLPATVAGHVLDLDLSGAYYPLLERGLGLLLGQADAAVEAVQADAGTARLLGVRTGAPLLYMQSVTRLDDGRPIDFVCSRTRPDRVVHTSTMRRPD
jgi:GntR family transcriptional regulator